MKFDRIDLAEGDSRPQFAALCWRMKAKRIQVLLITSRDTGRWVIPKGWPMDGVEPQDAALREAWEEAGVIGTPVATPLGGFGYDKVLSRVQGREAAVPCAVTVFAVEVSKLADKFPEEGQRKRKWVTRKKAATLVDEPELAALIAGFTPPVLA